ncbi:SDR family oxidoreductase [Yoonia sp. 208BN28-4]|uniref:SDR family oxidoreductase n=1 Tax=Yoonia sp. 208BN28-4 TaxID=3126505 RepID=UPI0030A16DF4
MSAIIITGASSGIGRACAEAFLADGWRVGLIARRGDALEEVAEGYDTAKVLPCDVTDEDAVDRAFAAFGHVDALFNNAGMFGPQTTIDQVSLQDWQQVVDVNLTGMFLCARAAFRAMREQQPMGGRIINNGSISAHSPREGSICYTSTKHAVTGLTKTLSLDGRPYDIACGQIDIGNARTDMVIGLEEKRAAEGLPPLPAMDVVHVAAAVLAMAKLPPEANVQFQTLMATKMPFVGRG